VKRGASRDSCLGQDCSVCLMGLCRVGSRADDGFSLEGDDEALDSSLIQQAPTVYVSELPSTQTAVSSQRLQDFRWTAGTLKPESGLGMHTAT